MAKHSLLSNNFIVNSFTNKIIIVYRKQMAEIFLVDHGKTVQVPFANVYKTDRDSWNYPCQAIYQP